MMPSGKARKGVVLRIYLALSHLFPLAAGIILKRRLAHGKEHPERWEEKQAIGLAPRPDGPLIWLNAVGLGEVLSVRGLIERIAAQRPDISFLVTSTTAASAAAFAKNTPPRTFHQFLPIDAPSYRARFLDHFAPDMCLWVEQDLWPGFAHTLYERGIPQALVAARMNKRSFRSHRRLRSLYSDLFQRMALVTAQDELTAQHLDQLGAKPTISGSLKPAAPKLGFDPTVLQHLQKALEGRFVWAVAPSHQEDERIAIAAHHRLCEQEPTALLIVAPRFPDRRYEITDMLGTRPGLRSLEQLPKTADSVWICDTFGELGLVYSVAQSALIGGTFNDVEGHNPWEAAALGTDIYHGPRTQNFFTDYTILGQHSAAQAISSADELARLLLDPGQHCLARNAINCMQEASKKTDQLAHDVVAAMGHT
ncbi:MAG: glycosyltransferase N-terminal domain-containing protein [Pseudomonadota bacterium]